jgi:hypothetical protein
MPIGNKVERWIFFRRRFLVPAVVLSALVFGTSAWPQEANGLRDAMYTMGFKKKHHAMAQSAYTGHIRFVEGRQSRSTAEADALARCRDAEKARLASGCKIIYVDGRENGRAVYDLNFPAEIFIFDASSGRETTRRGNVLVRNYYNNRSRIIEVSAGGRAICSGNLHFGSLGASRFLEMKGECFGFESSAQFPFNQEKWRMNFDRSYVEVRRAF